MSKTLIPKLPQLLKSKIYKTGQTRGADDDVIFQNRVNRNSTVLIPYDFYEQAKTAPDNNGIFENGFIVIINPIEYFENPKSDQQLQLKGLKIGENAILFYETRQQWNSYNPLNLKLEPATSRQKPLGGKFVARVPSTTSSNDEKISIGFNTSGQKGAGIRVYEYASKEVIKDCQTQLEYLFWNCIDANEVALSTGMTEEQIETRKSHIKELCKIRNLSDNKLLHKNRR